MTRLPCLLFTAWLVLGPALTGCRETKPESFGPRPIDTMSTGGASGTGGGAAGNGGTGGTGAGGASVDAGHGPDASVPADAKPVEGAADAVADAIIDVLPPDAGGAGDVVVPEVKPEVKPEVSPEVAVPVPDVAPVVDMGRTGPAACFPDPKVIAICLQLEAACLNCPGGDDAATACYAIVEKGDDAACAKYAVDEKCAVDTGGNVCGSLNCGVGQGPPVAAGCNQAACRTAQGNGDSSRCQPLLAACPCS